MTHDSRNILLSLIRVALTGKVDDLPSLSSVSWDEVMKIAGEQGMLALMYDGYCLLAKEGKAQMSLRDKTDLYGNVKIVEQKYATQEKLLEQLAAFYAENGIRTMVLKGYGLSRLYPVPNHRPCSDVDIYLYGDQQKADRLLTEKCGVKVSNEHHHHSEFAMYGILVENHYDFINVHAHSSSPCIERALKLLAKNEEGEEMMVGESRVFGMPPTLGVIFMLRHTAQHFAAMHVEIRYMVDWLLFTKRDADKIDWELVKRVAGENGLIRFMEAFDRLSRSLVEDIALNDIEQRIMADIWEPYYRGVEHNNWIFKAKRWWANRWKNQLVYKEGLINQAWTLARSRFVKPG